MFRRRDPAAPIEPDVQPAGPSAKVELPRRVVDVPVGPTSAPAPTAKVATGGEGSPAVVTMTRPEVPAGRQLTVGEGIEFQGRISACDRLTVFGRVDAELESSAFLEVGKGGCFEGRTEVDAAEIAGHVRGDLTVRGRLLVRSTGVVEGTVRFGELEIERGGQLRGNVGALDEPAPKVASLVNAVGGAQGA
jgi:cytoskeletal protein CcmA (bactofilin family)